LGDDVGRQRFLKRGKREGDWHQVERPSTRGILEEFTFVQKPFGIDQGGQTLLAKKAESKRKSSMLKRQSDLKMKKITASAQNRRETQKKNES